MTKITYDVQRDNCKLICCERLVQKNVIKTDLIKTTKKKLVDGLELKLKEIRMQRKTFDLSRCLRNIALVNMKVYVAKKISGLCVSVQNYSFDEFGVMYRDEGLCTFYQLILKRKISFNFASKYKLRKRPLSQYQIAYVNQHFVFT